MKPTKNTFLTIAATALLAAGLAAPLQAQQADPAQPPARSMQDRHEKIREHWRDMTPEQREQMKAEWRARCEERHDPAGCAERERKWQDRAEDRKRGDSPRPVSKPAQRN